MCLLLIAFEANPTYKLILAANRDEFYDRPTAPAEFWKDAPQLLAGRDLRAGGTWLGITKKGKIAAITNYRDPSSLKENAPSRGEIVSGFLLGADDPDTYLRKLSEKAGGYNGFNLILYEKDRLYWYSNRSEVPRHLSPGVYGLSNHLLDTPWPKIKTSKKALGDQISEGKNPSPEALFRILEDRTIAEDGHLPATGVGIEWERILSPIFIKSPDYGTRSSTLLFMDQQKEVTFLERTFTPSDGQISTVNQVFTLEA